MSCRQATVPALLKQQGIVLTHIPAMTPDSNINVLIEIPAGSIDKWEYDKERATVLMDSISGAPRKIAYLGYPANYGMVPNTLSSKSEGGDGDALDVIVLGPPLEQATIHECKVLGVLLLRDRGEVDDKLVAAHIDSPFAQQADLASVGTAYPGLLEIIELWFLNYKGSDESGMRMMSSCGYGDRATALSLLVAYKE